MEFTPSPQQLSFLWCVAVEANNTPVTKLSFDLRPVASRNELVRVGWVEMTTRSRRKYATLTEAGWYGLEQNLTLPLAKGKATGVVLRRLLFGISRGIEQRRISLAEILSGAQSEDAGAVPVARADSTRSIELDELRRRVYEACRCLSGDGVYDVRVRLSDLRKQLADVPRPALDRALKELEHDHSATFFPLDDPREIQPIDTAAALHNSSGAERHVLYLSRPSE